MDTRVAPRPAAPQAPTDQRKRLLVVDDEPTNLHVLRQVLQDEYRLLFATDGAKALQLAQQKPDLILRITCLPVSLSLYSAARPRRCTICSREACSSSARTRDRWVRTRARTTGARTGLTM